MQTLFYRLLSSGSEKFLFFVDGVSIWLYELFRSVSLASVITMYFSMYLENDRFVIFTASVMFASSFLAAFARSLSNAADCVLVDRDYSAHPEYRG